MTTGFTEQWLSKRLAKQGAKRSAAVAQSPEATTGRKYSFVVYGEPQPAGSKQAFPLLDKKRICQCGPIPGPLPRRRDNGSIVVNVPDDNKDTKAWRQHVSQTAREEYSGPLLTGYVVLECVFYLPRPQGHYGTGANANRVKPSAPAMPGVRPDVDKLLRAVGDGLKQAANVYTDDSLIVDIIGRKRYGNPRVEITISEVLIPEDEQPVLFEEKPPWEK